MTEPPIESVLEKLRSLPPGLTVLVEPSDNIGAGAPGDGTGMLRAFVKYKLNNAALAINDPQAVLKLQPLVIGENAELGIEVRIDKPSEAGADRLVNAIGAKVVYPGTLIVIDSGTATTLDVIADDGGFEGGVIAPGINLSMEALHAAAAKLPRVAIQKPLRVLGKDTVGAMQSGVFWGYVALIEGLIARIKAEWDGPMTVVATGGVASLFHGSTLSIDHFDPDLTIRGLLEIHRRNLAKAT